MKTTKLFILACFMPFYTAFAQENVAGDDPQAAKRTYLELSWIQVIPIKETKTGRQYELYIKLPEGYSENEDMQYPVLYFTDALWHVEILSSATEYLMENTILAGISWQKDIDQDLVQAQGIHVSRYRDYSVSPSSDPERQAKYQFGQAANHLEFVRNDVIRYIENNYRTDPGNRSYFGYSTGGLFGAYTLLAKPDTFRHYILGSPSLWRDNPLLAEFGSDKNLSANVFISYGHLETELGEHVETFVNMLKDKNDVSVVLKHEVIEGDHQTAFPLTGVRGVTWLSGLIKE